MIIKPTRSKIYIFFAACLFFKGLIVSTMVMASNEVIKVGATGDQGRTGIMVFLKARPSFTLSAAGEAHIILTFNDTVKGASFEKAVPAGDILSVGEAGEAGALKLDIRLKRPFSRIDSSWLEEKKLLFIDITPTEGNAVAAGSPRGSSSLEDIRFGFIEGGTRMMMKVGNSPSWEMEFNTPSTVKMRLLDVSNDLKKLKFGPVKRLREVNISKTKDKATEMSLELESPLTRVGLFRMIAEDRLVLDIMDKPGEMTEGTPASGIETPAAAAGSRPEAAIIEDKGNYVRMKINGNPAPSDTPATADGRNNKARPEAADIPVAEAETRPEEVPVPEKALETEAAAPTHEPVLETTGVQAVQTETEKDLSQDSGEEDEKEIATAIAIDGSVNMEPELDKLLPLSTGLTRTTDDLTPDEAFLYGMIKQAMDIRDYEKGIDLINQLVKKLPDSSLVEEMMFLKGDLYYYLWKNGDDGASNNAVSSYQKAIDRFPESPFVPSGYIKMAQLQSSNGEEYLALGYLGLVIARKDVDELLPFAYITRGKVFMRLNQYEKALADFNLVMERYGDSQYAIEADFWIANYYHVTGKYADAEKKLEEVQELDPEIFIEHPDYLFLRAKNYLYLDDYEGAREYLFKAVNIGRQPEGADMLLARIGDTYHNQKKEKEAEKYYRMVVDYYPETEGASISRLRIAAYSSDTGVMDELIAHTGNESISELAMLQKGYNLYDNGKYADAAETVKQLVDKPVETETRKSARILFFNAAEKEIAGLYKAGKLKETTDFYAPLKGLLAGNIKNETMLNVAQAYKGIGLIEEAIAAFKGINLNELDIQQKGPYFIGFAESYLGDGDIADARALLEKSKSHSLQSADRQRVSRILALIYIEENNPNEAYTLCRSIMDGDKQLPDDELADVYILAARILNMQKRYAEAEETINAAPGMPDGIKGDSLRAAYMELAKACYHNGDYSKAASSFERGFELGYGEANLDYWNLRLDLAESYLKAGDGDRARTIFTEVSEGGDSISQQRAQLQIGSMDLEQQLQRLPLGRN